MSDSNVISKKKNKKKGEKIYYLYVSDQINTLQGAQYQKKYHKRNIMGQKTDIF